MTPKVALETIELFVNNLIEYVENITDGDYDSKEDAIETIAGDEDAFWEAVEVLKGGK